MRRWGMVPLAASLVALVTVLLLGVASVQQAATADRNVVAESQDLRGWTRYADPTGQFTLRHPAGWRAEPWVGGVTLWPSSGGEGVDERGAALHLRVGEAASDPLAASLALMEAQPPADTLRTAENVAVGGLSGAETLSEFALAADRALPLDGNARAALGSARPARVTMVLWQSPAQAARYWVLLVDARDGAFLDDLARMRETIEWR